MNKMCINSRTSMNNSGILEQVVLNVSGDLGIVAKLFELSKFLVNTDPSFARRHTFFYYLMH